MTGQPTASAGAGVSGRAVQKPAIEWSARLHCLRCQLVFSLQCLRNMAAWAVAVTGTVAICTTALADEGSEAKWEFAISDDPAAGSDVDWLSVPIADTAGEQASTSADPKHCDGVCRHPGHPRKPLRKLPGDKNCKDCLLPRYRMCDHCRAGFPEDVAKWAVGPQPSCYSASYVGGGAVCVGRPRGEQEGTWGRDYHGLLSPDFSFLWWTCGRRQGGEGAYQTDHERRFSFNQLRARHGLQ